MLTNLGRVIRRSKDQFRRSVVPRADVRHVWLVLNQYLSATEIAELQHAGAGVQQQILWLDVAVTDSLGVDIGQGAEQLVGVELDLEDRHGRLHLVEVPRRAVDGLGNELLDKVEVDLVFLRGGVSKQNSDMNHG